MSKSNPTHWNAEPHTTAKHKILAGYLKAWMPIMTTRFKSHGRVRYIEAFAGPGQHSDGSPGSPVVALKVALDHVKHFDCPVDATFIEQNAERHSSLIGILRGLGDQHSRPTNVQWNPPVLGDGEETLQKMLANPRFGPALVFLDQFGYSQVSMNLIGSIMQREHCEVFSFLNWRDMNRWMSDPHKALGITRAYGSEEWKEALDLPESKRRLAMLEAYESALKARARVRYLCRFDMRDKNDKLLYWLFFCSQSMRGLEEMKKSMWKVDASGQFHFSDRHANQPFLLHQFDDDWLAEALLKDLVGRTLDVASIKEHVLVNTPCFQFARALSGLEKRGKIDVENAPSSRRRGSFLNFEGTPSFRVIFHH